MEHSTQSAASPMLTTAGWTLLCWLHYSIYRPRCHWPSWLHGKAASSYWAGCQSAPLSPFLTNSFQVTPPSACTAAWRCCDPSAWPGISPYWTSCSCPWPIAWVCPHPTGESFSPWTHQCSHPMYCLRVHPSKLWADSFSKKMLWHMVSNALLKSSYTASMAFPSSVGCITLSWRRRGRRRRRERSGWTQNLPLVNSLAGVDALVILGVLCHGTQDDLFHNPSENWR